MTFIVVGCESWQISILEDNLSFPIKLLCHQNCQARLLCRWSLAFAFIGPQLKGWESLPRLDHLSTVPNYKAPRGVQNWKMQADCKESAEKFHRYKKMKEDLLEFFSPILSSTQWCGNCLIKGSSQGLVPYKTCFHLSSYIKSYSTEQISAKRSI